MDRGELTVGGFLEPDERVVGAGERLQDLIEFSLRDQLLPGAWLGWMTNTDAKVIAATTVWKMFSRGVANGPHQDLANRFDRSIDRPAKVPATAAYQQVFRPPVRCRRAVAPDGPELRVHHRGPPHATAGGPSPTMDADARIVPSRGPFGAAPTAEPAGTERWNDPANAPRVRPRGLGSRPAVAPHPRCTRYAQAKVVAAQPRCPAQAGSWITAARPVSTAPRSAALSTSLSSFRRRSTSITSTTITAQQPPC